MLVAGTCWESRHVDLALAACIVWLGDQELKGIKKTRKWLNYLWNFVMIVSILADRKQHSKPTTTGYMGWGADGTLSSLPPPVFSGHPAVWPKLLACFSLILSDPGPPFVSHVVRQFCKTICSVFSCFCICSYHFGFDYWVICWL